MKLYKLDLLTLLISLFILSGCQKIDSIGLDVDPLTDINANFVDTSTIKSFTVREDSVISSGLSQYPLGYLNDPIFGKTYANIASSVFLQTNGYSFGTSPVLDSAVLVLHYGDTFFGDSTSYFKLNVFQLQAKLANQNYYNTSTFPVFGSAIGTTLSRFNRRDSVNVTEIIDGKPDKNLNKKPHLRMRMDPAFITSNFLNAPSTVYASNEAFLNQIRGFYLTIDPSQTTGRGGIGFFDMRDSSRLEIYYKNTSGTTVDTNVVRFPLTNIVASNFRHDYSGTAIQTQLNNSTTEYNVNYVQGLAGLRTKIRFPNLENLKNLGEITVNKAELVVTVEGGSDLFQPASRLVMYQSDIAGQRVFIPDYGNGAVALPDTDFGGFYDKTQKRYKFVVTTYIQDIIKGKSKQYEAFLMPVNNGFDRSFGFSSSATTLGSTVIGSGKTGVNYKMKLNIIYSKIN